MKHKNKSPKIAALALLLTIFIHPVLAGGPPPPITEPTQWLNKLVLGARYTKQAKTYAQQLLQYEEQLKEFDLEEIASSLFEGVVLDVLIDNASEDTLDLMDDMLDIVKAAKNLEHFKGMNREELVTALSQRELSKALGMEAKEQSEMNKKVMKGIKESADRLKELQRKITEPNLGANQLAQLQAQIDIAIAAEAAAARQDAILRDQLKAKAKVTVTERKAAQEALFQKKIEYEQERASSIRSGNGGTYGNLPSF